MESTTFFLYIISMCITFSLQKLFVNNWIPISLWALAMTAHIQLNQLPKRTIVSRVHIEFHSRSVSIVSMVKQRAWSLADRCASLSMTVCCIVYANGLFSFFFYEFNEALRCSQPVVTSMIIWGNAMFILLPEAYSY